MNNKRSPEEFAKASWNTVTQDAMAASAAVPTMLAGPEQRFYHWLGRDWVRGDGAIVDLGCFVGGSTARLAAGVAASDRHIPIHAYDRFTADEKVKAKFLKPAGVPDFKGEDTFPLVKELLAPWIGDITLQRGMIEDIGWSAGPIELLVMDASKNTRSMDAMAAAFFPSLMPGRSLVVQQDYLHFAQPWVPVQMHRLRDWFTPVAFVENDTVAFLCTRRLGPRALRIAACSGLTDEKMLAELHEARETMQPFGLAARLDQSIAALKAAPGARYAHLIGAPPAA